MTEKSPASSVHSTEQPSSGSFESATVAESHAFVADRSAWDEQPQQQQPQQQQTSQAVNSAATECNKPPPVCTQTSSADDAASSESELDRHRVTAAMTKAVSQSVPPASPTGSVSSIHSATSTSERNQLKRGASLSSNVASWVASPEWVHSWKQKLPLQTIMRLLQVLVPQVEKICIDKGLTDESEILKFLQHGTLVGLLPVPHPILIRKYQANSGTTMWFRTYMWGVIYLRNVDPPIWYDTDVKLFEIQRV